MQTEVAGCVVFVTDIHSRYCSLLKLSTDG